MGLHRDKTGRGLHEPALYKVQNNSGATLTKGTVVKRVGYANFITVEISTNPVSDNRIGVVLDDIEDGCPGYVGAQGDFGQFDTSSWAADTVLYSDATGALTTTVLGDAIGTVLTSDASTGHIFLYVALPVAGGATTVDGYLNFTGTVTATDVTNGYVSIPLAPSSPANTLFLYEGAPSLIYGLDFTVSGSQLQFLALTPQVAAGDQYTILYKG